MALYFVSACLLAVCFLHTEAGKIPIDLSGQIEYLEGDIMIREGPRNGIFASKRWTNNIIPYEWNDQATWDADHKNMVAAALKEIETHSCLKFKIRTNEANYIRIINGTGCWSEVGMSGGRQHLSLKDSAYGSCWFHGTIVHEFMHAIGLWHEQSRYDRDQYVTINLDNVEKGMRYNFDKKPQTETDVYNVPYNYLSVMHYDKLAFSNNGKVTIQTKDINYQDMIGHRGGAQETDYEKIRRIYKCTGSFPTRPAPKPPACEDKMTYCAEQLHNCNKESWTWYYCRKSCKYCK